MSSNKKGQVQKMLEKKNVETPSRAQFQGQGRLKRKKHAQI